jgi:flagellar hook-associated protein 1 FlgK
VEGKWFQVTMEKEHTREVVLDDNDLYGALQAQRETLTEEGEFSSADDQAIDENALTKRGIPYYQKSFDLLARQLAQHFNELNQGYMLNHKGNYVDKDGKEFELAGKPVSKYDGLTAEQKQALIDDGCVLKDENGNNILDDDGNPIPDLERWLDAKGAVKMGGPLFTNSNAGNDTDGITASNIDISKGWSSGEWMVVPKFEVLFPDDKPADGEEGEGGLNHTTQDININHMITLIDKGLVYDPKDMDPDAIGKNLFTGSFNDMFSNMMGVQAKDSKATNIALNNDYTTLVALDSSREGVSGVDLNDEAMNMMQYQKAMNAAMRLMTAIDEALDRLINNTGMAGR